MPIFISIRASHAGCDTSSKYSISRFQFPHPQVATQQKYKYNFNSRTCEGCDYIIERYTIFDVFFQLAHPRGMRLQLSIWRWLLIYFNSRTMHGCDNSIAVSIAISPANFNSHPLLGCTQLIPTVLYFNSRIPYGMRRVKLNGTFITARISIPTPA